MNEQQMRTVAKLAAVFAAISTAVCLWRAATKPVVIEGTVQAQEETSESDAPLEEIYDAKVLTLVPLPAGADEADDLTIPLPAGTRSEDVRTENHYFSHQLWITLRTSRSNYDREGAEISVNADKVREGASVRTERTSVSLRFGLTGFYEPMVSLAEGVLHVRLRTPREAYPRVILVDPVPADDLPVDAEGGAQRDVTLAVAQAFAALYEGDGRTRVYLTRMGRAWEEEQSLAFLQETGANILIRLYVGKDADIAPKGAVRVIYNDTWYLRRYTNAELARDLAAGIADAADVGIAGLDPVGSEDSLLSVCEVPGAAIDLGGVLYAGAQGETVTQTAGGIREAVELAFAAMEHVENGKK